MHVKRFACIVSAARGCRGVTRTVGKMKKRTFAALIAATTAGLLGFGGLATEIAVIAQAGFFMFFLLFLASLLAFPGNGRH